MTDESGNFTEIPGHLPIGRTCSPPRPLAYIAVSANVIGKARVEANAGIWLNVTLCSAENIKRGQHLKQHLKRIDE